jgi:hypothetical protein
MESDIWVISSEQQPPDEHLPGLLVDRHDATAETFGLPIIVGGGDSGQR